MKSPCPTNFSLSRVGLELVEFIGALNGCIDKLKFVGHSALLQKLFQKLQSFRIFALAEIPDGKFPLLNGWIASSNCH